MHHRKYPRVFGQEKMAMLVPVCGPCHQQIHELHRGIRGLRIYAATRLVQRIHRDGYSETEAVLLEWARIHRPRKSNRRRSRRGRKFQGHYSRAHSISKPQQSEG